MAEGDLRAPPWLLPGGLGAVRAPLPGSHGVGRQGVQPAPLHISRRRSAEPASPPAPPPRRPGGTHGRVEG